MERMNLRRTVQRLPIFGLGCAGGAIGLARAAAIARSNPGALVLFLVVELCALSFRRDDFSKSNIVATALFGDGAAAALISCSGKGASIVAGGEFTWPDSLDVMGWEVTRDGLKAIFSRDIPELITTKFHDVVLDFLAKQALTLHDIDCFICHPGGAKVIDALERAFELEPLALQSAREVLRDYGNMSAATVMFVLERTIGDSLPWKRALRERAGPRLHRRLYLARKRMSVLGSFSVSSRCSGSSSWSTRRATRADCSRAAASNGARCNIHSSFCCMRHGWRAWRSLFRDQRSPTGGCSRSMHFCSRFESGRLRRWGHIGRRASSRYRGRRRVRRGPYRIFRHPNYIIVCAEIAVLPLAFGAREIAILFSFLNAALLSWRIRLEERALTKSRSFR